MNTLMLSQIQFAVTTVYHFFFVPLTLGLSVLIAIIETIYVRTGKQIYKDMAKFWGKLFLINFAMGVVTGIVQEFQFGMNWSEYSRFVGDIFGAPLAIEALLAFFLESTFLGVWVFGWERLSKGIHAVTIWLVALASNLSALWILIANSFMQHPVGYQVQENGRAVMTDFLALVTNPYVHGQFSHTVTSGFVTGAFFMLGICAYHLIKKQHVEFFTQSFRIASIFGMVAIVLVIAVGHSQAQYMVRTQPMKMAAAEALWNSEDPANLSLFTLFNQEEMQNYVDIRIPNALSLLAYNSLTGEVRGMRQLQSEYEQKYGPGYYIPSVAILYWTFRIMVGVGFLMLFLAAYMLFLSVTNRPFPIIKIPVLNLSTNALFPLVALLPYFATTTGWIMTEMGRQPWIVFGEMKTSQAVSPLLAPEMVLASLLVFIFVYGALMAADIYLLLKFAKAGPLSVSPD